MRKFFKRIAAVILAAFMMICSSATAFAENGSQLYETVNIDGIEMFLISEKTSIEDGCAVTSRIFSSVNPRSRAASGSGTYRHEKELTYDNNNLTYWVQGYFTWNETNDTATVSNVKYGYNPLQNINAKDHNIDYGSNQGATFLFGKKYAYARYTFTAVNPVGLGKICKCIC